MAGKFSYVFFDQSEFTHRVRRESGDLACIGEQGRTMKRTRRRDLRIRGSQRRRSQLCK